MNHFRLLSIAVLVLGLTTVYGGDEAVYSTQRSEHLASSGFDRFEVSLGYSYLHLNDTTFEPEHLHGADVSAFVNLNSWLGIGGDFLAEFGSVTQHSIFGTSVDVDSERYLYVFGPRITVWRSPEFRLFVQALAGGVHAHAEASVGSFSQSASEDGFAAVAGIGADWRISDHISWRIIEADYVPTELDDFWQHNFRVSTGIVFTFGRR